MVRVEICLGVNCLDLVTMRKVLFISLWGSLAFLACNKEAEVSLVDEVKHVVISANDFKNEFESRTNLSISSEGAIFSWASKDTVGIFPNDGAQVYFPMEEGAGTKTASFTGGGWALKNGFTYSAYYPFIGNYYVDRENLPLQYTGQKQTGNASTAHLGEYDFMAARPTAPRSGYVNFQFDHLSCLVQMRLTVPVASTFTSLRLSGDESVFTNKAKFGFSGSNYTFTSIENTNQLDLELVDIASTEVGQLLTFYMMMAPLDMTGKTIHVSLLGSDNKTYRGILESKNMQAGYSYDFQVTLEEVTDNLSAVDIKAPGLGNAEHEI